jgi:stalled ribosome rescue protein Dom34
MLENQKIFDEVNVLTKYFEAIEIDSPVSFGLRQTVQALDDGAVEELILSEEQAELPYDAETLFATHAKNKGINVVVVSSASKEGTQFLAMGGIGALLKFRPYEYVEECYEEEDDSSFE